MIKKLKIKIIALSMASLFLLLTVIVSGMNILNYRSLIAEADEVLLLLSQNRGTFPDFSNDKMHPLPPDMSPELPHESRYFSVLVTENGTAMLTETSKIASVDSEQAESYADKVLESDNISGFTENFRYKKNVEGNALRITFLDCGRKLDAFYGYLSTSIFIALTGFIIVFVIFVFISGKIIKPIAESYEKQKRFITDAGHEIKTPLTIINANADVLEMDIGKNECIDDIHRQAQKLTELTNNLVTLARMEEGQDALVKIDSPVSEITENTVQAFKGLALSQNKELICDIEPMLNMVCNAKAIEQLISLLTDNALKYSPDGSTVLVKLFKKGKSIVLSVTNKTESIPDPQSLNRVFDRFYRTDSSRNSETGGHGIGLSVAKAIANAHNAKIQAHADNDNNFCVLVTF